MLTGIFLSVATVYLGQFGLINSSIHTFCPYFPIFNNSRFFAAIIIKWLNLIDKFHI